MTEKETPGPPLPNEQENLPETLQPGNDPTEAIDPGSQFSNDVTSSGSFDIRGDIWATTFGKLVQALPMPALLIDRSDRVIVVNEACGKISPEYQRIQDTRFSNLFPHPNTAKEVKSLMKEVFSTGKTRSIEGTLAIGQGRIWGRMTFRSIRMGKERFILVLVEDLTAERKQLLVKQKHQEETLKTTEQLRGEIRELKQAKEELRRSEEKHRTILETITDGYYELDLLGKISFINESICEIMGYSRKELVGMDYRALVDEHNAERAYEAFNNVYLTGEADPGFDYEITRKDRTKRAAVVSIFLERDADGRVCGFHGTFRDITKRKRAQEALQESEKKYHSLVVHAPIGIIFVDREGRIIEVNPSLLEILGSPSAEATKSINMYTFPPLVESGISDAFKRCMEEGRNVEIETPYTSKWGKTSYFRVILTPMHDLAKDVHGCLGVIEDVTEKKGLEKQLRQAQKMEAIGTLAGGVAHDFNNLLQIVLGHTDMLLMDKDKEDSYRNGLLSIRRAAHDGADLVRRLLMFGTKVEPELRPIDLNREVRRVLRLLQRTIPRMIEIEILLADDLRTVNADPQQIEHVLLNLAVNAQHAMPEGGRLTIETRNVTLDDQYIRTHLEAEPGEYALLMVSDTGHGMEKEVVDRIFEPFYTTKGVGEGTGLGLAMVFGIVRAHGGYIACYSEPGTGSTFKMYLPVMGAVTEPDMTMTREMPAFGTETILLADDEEQILDLTGEMLGAAGYKVLAVEDGQKALEVYRKEKGNISLVILDLIMPKMGGRECLERLLKIDPKVKVLVASGHSANGPTKEAVGSGAVGFISKPYDAKEILRMVRKVLDEG